MSSSLRNKFYQMDVVELKLNVKNLHFPEVILDPESIAKFQEGQIMDQ